MSSVKRVGDLEIAHDLPFQRGEWLAQRIGWGVMGVVLLAALLGVFGSGPLSDAEAAEGGLRVEYERVVRFETPHVMAFTVPAAEGTAELLIGREFLEISAVSSVSPEPESWEWTAEGALLTFAASGASEVEVSFEYKPRRIGPATLRMRAGTGETVDVHLLVLP